MDLDNEKSQIFHMLAGCFLTGRSYSEYCEMFFEVIPTHNSKGLPIKGNKSLKAFTNDAFVKTNKHMAMLEVYLNENKDAYKITLNEIDKLQKIASSLIMLSPTGQMRVENLIAKISKDQTEIDYWKEFENEG